MAPSHDFDHFSSKLSDERNDRFRLASKNSLTVTQSSCSLECHIVVVVRCTRILGGYHLL